MGANAVTTVPVYTAGEVLTAADLNITNSGIPVFATTVTRDAAFGGTGEKTLAEGQFAYIEATNTTQYYDGAAWQTVGVTPGLVCVKAETAFSAVASVTADNVFTSSYTNYVLLVQASSSTNVQISLQLSVGGVAATTNYNLQRLEAASTSVTAARNTAQSAMSCGQRSDAGSQSQPYEVHIFQPQLATQTSFTSVNAANNGASFDQPYIGVTSGNHTTATAYDGIKLLVSTGTMTGFYAIYGYSKTV
jgi:hypothetical protein